jgi:alginate O-acetyltransferase complex protein AlgJ
MSNEDVSAMTAVPIDPARPAASGATLAAVVFILVMLAGVWQIIRASQQIGPGDVPHTWQDFWQGRTTSALAKHLERNLPERATLVATANSLRYLLAHGGGEQVRVGRDGWLFFTDELRFHEDAQSNLAARADLLHAASVALERHGVKLVVALVPDKARVYSAHLTGELPDHSKTRYQDALSALQARGVAAVDLLGPLVLSAKNGEVYYRSDTHWNQAGAQAAAAAIATGVRRLSVALTPTEFATEKSGAETERPGDLIRLMGLENAPNALRPLPDRETLLVTRQTSADSSNSLFGDAPVEVVLTGTSYSLRANFHGFLQQALGAKVLNTAKDGGGFLEAVTEYLKDEAFRSSPPKVLIWEVPERFLGAKLEGEAGWMQEAGL